MFKEFENLPQKVEAVQFTDENKNMVFNSLTGNVYPHFENLKPVLDVKTINGDIIVIRIGDWIVKDSEIGTYYSLPAETFRKLFKK